MLNNQSCCGLYPGQD